MKKRLLSGLLLALMALVILLSPWPGNYQSPLLWAREDALADQPIDVFLIGATADLGADGTMLTTTYRPVDREWQEKLLNLQKGVYDSVGRIYAPYYRQACLSVYYLPDEARGPWFHVAYGDVRKAFLWYLQHENQGRPFILAGYSQGADMGLRLMEEFFGNKALQDRLVAAYLIGWRITQEDLAAFPQLHMAQGPEDTGVIVSFNSEAPGVTGTIIVPQGGYTYGINPINWRADGTPADRSENPGSVDLHMDGSADNEIQGLAGCYQSPERGTMIVPDISPKDFPPGEPLFVEGCYHNFELNLYYRSLQKNVQDRTTAYLSTH